MDTPDVLKKILDRTREEVAAAKGGRPLDEPRSHISDLEEQPLGRVEEGRLRGRARYRCRGQVGLLRRSFSTMRSILARTTRNVTGTTAVPPARAAASVSSPM